MNSKKKASENWDGQPWRPSSNLNDGRRLLGEAFHTYLHFKVFSVI